MSGNPMQQDNLQDACGCCEGINLQSPVELYNRPGLTVIAYRIGTHHQILASLQARLSFKALPALVKLRTRDRDDFSIALLDAYACMADVLSFYQERLANESYLRTAGERLSLSALARLIGYRLKPGIAAETYLAFTLEEPPLQSVNDDPKQASGVPENVTLPIGIKVQSVPQSDETPQIFETVESIEARPTWNVFKARTHEMVIPAFGTQIVYLKGTANQLKAGDALLFVGSERELDSGSERWDFRRILSVTLDSEAGHTIVALERGLGTASPFVAPAANPKVFALRLRASLFGHNAPDWRVMSDDIKRGYLELPDGATVTDTQWPGFTIADISDPPTSTPTGTGLYGEYFDTRNLTDRKLSRIDTTINFDWGAGSPDPLIGANTFSVRWTGWVNTPVTGIYTFYTTSDDGVRLWVNNHLLINNWTDHGVTENSGSISLTAGKKYDIKLEYYENTGAAIIKLSWAPPGQSKQIIPQSQLYPRNIHTLHLDAVYPQIVPDSWLVLSIPEYQELYQVVTAGEDARARFMLTGKTTRLTVKGENLRELFNERVRETAVFASSELLELTETPITTDVAGDSLRIDRKAETLMPKRSLILSGMTTEGAEESEILTLLKVESDGENSRLFFTTALQHRYRRDSVRVYANVARATHGETVQQTLGSGSARQAHQRFDLKHAPLTHIAADTESGAKPALEVRVNDVLWHETATLYDAKANDASYVLHTDEYGTGTIQFGDGRHGARLPTGQENVRAKYRKGIGRVGNLQAGQLSQLLTRPLGLKAASNPLAASGGVDADSIDHARRNMPLGVRTLGRVVSLQDYEDFARAYPGVAKAKAAVLNTRAGRTIVITVAGEEGEMLSDSILTKLLNSLKKNGDPLVRCEVAVYQLATFRLAMRIKLHPDHERDIVMKQVEMALRTAFSFDARDFGQWVARSEIIAATQTVKGVMGVDLDRFYRGVAITLEGQLAPHSATVDGFGNAVAAELLLLDDAPFDYLEEMP
ncbi:putative baseplate assembly protein [Nitrosomonas nitrosa]|uniref:Putative baseplate assembly protein n=1 Tax=Nitrosomonas nitrosa TaxID=52442 RepID=A0A1I4M1W2_9PROT|nr:putative baseplate assembly protein [Nitrosomonas nitrosa]CAE6484244.1 putative baseplate assembly protein [Nitrosomonas nitrosa]SFL97179.1 putative baseplate assembly protein [Nitrosomonas nitrosa]